jgi:3-phosphoshikimate 1-carboxyvinyltransferase
MFAALAEGTSHIIHFPHSADPRSTLACLQALGVDIEEDEAMITVKGRGLDGFVAPEGPLDCGNSGTTMRLLAGILSGQ